MPNWLQHLAGWVKMKNGASMERFDVQTLEIQFIDEQDGPVERDFKAALRKTLAKHEGVLRAYLAVVKYSKAGPEFVMLCLRFEHPNVDESVIADLGEEFRARFSAAQSLDILPMNAAQEKALLKVCRPFYDHDAASNLSPFGDN